MAWEMNGNFGDQKGPGWEINSIMGWSLAGISPQNPAQQAQNWGNPVTPDNVTPPDDIFWGNANVNIANYFDQLKQATTYDQLGVTPQGNDINMKVTAYENPNLNDAALTVIRQWIPVAKPAKSWIGLPENLGLGTDELWSAIDVLNTYLPQYQKTSGAHAAAVQQFLPPILQAQTAYQQAKQGKDPNATAESLAKLKMAIGTWAWAIKDFLNTKYYAGTQSEDEAKDASLLSSIVGKVQDFASYYDKSWADLNQYLQQAMIPIVRTYDAPASSLPSQQAKKDMIANPWYTTLVNQYQGTPAYDILTQDVGQPTITASEKKFLAAVQPQIQSVKEQYQAVYDQYGYKTAQSIYKDMLPLFDLESYQYDTMLDDIYNSMGTGIMNNTQPLYWNVLAPIIQ